MKFTIQQNLLDKHQLQTTFGAVAKYPHVKIDMVPFVKKFSASEVIVGTDYIPYGSTLFIQTVAKLKWRGLFFDLDRLNYREALNNHPKMLNSGLFTVPDAIRFLQNQPPTSKWFIRPSNDLKQFSGQVEQASVLWVWLESMIAAPPDCGSYYMDPQLEVVICEPKQISAEWRWFIVGGKIVSGSMYKAHNQLRKIRETDAAVVSEAQALADFWLPHDCVVMDTALVGDDVRVIEFNTINSSGFYDNDVEAIFDALWKYCTERQ